MKSIITKSDSSDSSQPVTKTAVYLSDDWFGEESAEAGRTVLWDLIKRGPQRPQFLIVDGAAGLLHARPREGDEPTFPDAWVSSVCIGPLDNVCRTSNCGLMSSLAPRLASRSKR